MDRKHKEANRIRRRRRIRKKVSGTPDRPRLSVYRSLKNVQAQLVDDMSGRSLLGVSSLSPEIREVAARTDGKCEVSREVGRRLAALAKERGIVKVVFDRNGCLFHGRVKALAEGAREGGLEF